MAAFSPRIPTWTVSAQSTLPSTAYSLCRANTASSREDNTLIQLKSRTRAQAKPEGSDSSDNERRRRHTIQSVFTSNPARTITFSLLMTMAGAALGPFLDSYHSAFGVLQYEKPLTATLWGSSEHPALITTWWVPQLFGLAGFLIGWLYIVLDTVLATIDDDGDNGSSNSDSRLVGKAPSSIHPSPPKILLGISLFTLQYWLSGILYQSGVIDRTTILNIMSVIAATGFWRLDNTMAGFFTSTATAVGGPLIEVGLLSLSRAGALAGTGYHYTDLGETGFFPLWIVPVYFLGGPAVGNLARGIWNGLSHALLVDEVSASSSTRRKNDPPGCSVCQDTRRVPCPNCDGVGTYVAMGGRQVTCTSCRGRGFVICRNCYSNYDEDPNDIDVIREILSRMPD